MPFRYPTDISFDCSKCGLCCGDTTKKVRHVLLLKSDAERIATHTNRKVDTFVTEVPGNLPYLYEIQKCSSGKCIFLHDNQCTVYDVRPLICRFYPFELSTDKAGVYIFKTTDECPGICTGTVGTAKLDANYFKKLLKLARADLSDRPR